MSEDCVSKQIERIRSGEMQFEGNLQCGCVSNNVSGGLVSELLLTRKLINRPVKFRTKKLANGISFYGTNLSIP